MASDKVTRQDISALADGELEFEQARKVIIALRDPEQRHTWSVYHQIGDSLREQQRVASVSAQFSARMAARLDAETTVLAPVGLFRRVQTWPTALAAMAAAVMAFVLAPPLNSFWTPAAQHELVADSARLTTSKLKQSQATLAANTAQSREQASQRRAAEVDDYIFAHQSAYPSLYGTAQLARPASHSESEK